MPDAPTISTTVVDIQNLAEACRDRVLPAALLEGKITQDQLQLNPGDVDLALIERTLRAIENQEDLLVVSPFASPLEPALVLLSYMKESDPTVPDRINEGLPALLLKYGQVGYVGAIKNFDYSIVVKYVGDMYEYEPVDELTEIDDSHVLYSAKSSYVLSTTSDPVSLGVLFVDLRSDSWKSALADVEAFTEYHNISSVVYYADGWDHASKTAEEIADTTFELTQEHMLQSEVTDTTDEMARPDVDPSPTRLQEAILNSPIDVTVRAKGHPEIDEALKRLYGKRRQVLRVAKKTHWVRLLNGLLLDLPVPPKRYDNAANKNAFYDSTWATLEKIQDSIAATDPENASDTAQRSKNKAFKEFREQASTVRFLLMQTNPRRQLMEDTVDRASNSSQRTKVVVRNDMFQQAVKHMLLHTMGAIPTNVEIVTRNDVMPDPDAHVIYASAPPRSSSLYEFPPANEITFITYPFLADSVADRVREMASGNPSPELEVTVNIEDDTEETASSQDSGDDAATINLTNIEEDIDPSMSSSADDSRRDRSDSCDIWFTDGTQYNTHTRRQMTVYEDTRDGIEVEHQPAETLEPGQRVVVLRDAADELYAQLVEHKHDTQRVKKEQQWVDLWRERLSAVLEGDDAEYTYAEFLTDMQEKGSEIEREQTIRQWVSGETIGPRDHNDVRITMAIASPRHESNDKNMYEAMEYIRLLHQRIGQKVRDKILAQLDPNRSPKIETEIDAQLNELVEDAELKQVQEVSLTDSD